jgi:hypothetical protein
MNLESYVGRRVILKESVPADRRGRTIPPGAMLVVSQLVGTQHFNLNWPDGKRAANQVHYTNLKTA